MAQDPAASLVRINRIAIDSVDDRRVADFRIVSDPALMRERGLFVAEGRLAVERLLASPFRTRALLLTAGVLARLESALDPVLAPVPAPVLAACPIGAGGLDVYLTDSARLRQITGFRFHRGCLALGVRPARAADDDDEDDDWPAAEPARPLVALEGVSNPDNVGSIFRNAAAFGAAGVVLSPACADPLYRKAIRTSMGTTLTLPFRVAGEWPGALRRIRASGARLVALTPDCGATDLETFAARVPGGPLALLLGNEGDGVSGPALDLCDARVRVDIEPAVDSLNVATAAAIVLQRLRAVRAAGVTTDPPTAPPGRTRAARPPS